MNFVLGYDKKSFSDDVISRWGVLSEDLVEDKNLLHPQMACLGRLCVSGPGVASEVLSFLGDLLRRDDAITEIENAIAISFLQWPDLERMRGSVTVPDNVADVVREQWDRHGSNS